MKGHAMLREPKRQLFPYEAVIERGQEAFSIHYPRYPDIVAHGKTNGDDPQKLAEDLFCVILDMAAHDEVAILDPVERKADSRTRKTASRTNFPVKVTPRLMRCLASYGYKLASQVQSHLVPVRTRVRFTQPTLKKIGVVTGQCQPSVTVMPPQRKHHAERSPFAAVTRPTAFTTSQTFTTGESANTASPESSATSVELGSEKKAASGAAGYISTFLRYDQEARVMVLLFRDVDTGATQDQIPSQRVVEEYRRNASRLTAADGAAMTSQAAGQTNVSESTGTASPGTGTESGSPSGSTSVFSGIGGSNSSGDQSHRGATEG